MYTLTHICIALCCVIKELICVGLTALLGMPGGVLLFLPLYHLLHDIIGIHSEVTFFMLFTVILLISWTGDGTFPDRLEYSEIKPIYKKGDKTLIINYRPISLLPVFSKIFEKVLYKRLYYHLTLSNILVKEQFGFRCNSSTETAIYTLINNILSSLNNRIIVGGLFCDLQNAFDCVNCDILLSKMKFYDITGVANRLMESYLRNRYQRVIIQMIIDLNGKKYSMESHRVQFLDRYCF